MLMFNRLKNVRVTIIQFACGLELKTIKFI